MSNPNQPLTQRFLLQNFILIIKLYLFIYIKHYIRFTATVKQIIFFGYFVFLTFFLIFVNIQHLVLYLTFCERLKK